MKRTIKIFLHLFSITILASAVFLGGMFDRLLTKVSKSEKKNTETESGGLTFAKEAFADVIASDGGWSSGDGCGVSDSSTGDGGGNGDDC